MIPRRLPDKQALGEPITIKNLVIDTIITLTALHKLTFYVEHNHGIPREGNLQSSIQEAPRSNPLPFCVKTIKASDTLEHQPTLRMRTAISPGQWQPYGQLFRPC